MNPLWRFLNPLDKAGGLVGRLVAPVAMLIAASLTVPGSPLQVAGMISGVDVSVYGGRIETASWRAMGNRVAVVGLWHGLGGNPYAEANLIDAQTAGYIPAGYVALSPSKGGAEQVDRGRDFAGSQWDSLSFVAVDVEIDGVTMQQIVDAMNRVATLGQRPIVYTASWWWRGHFGNPCIPGGAYLWNAYYDGDPDVDYDGYGCFTLIGEQYTGTTDLFGVSVDQNVFDEEFILAGLPVTIPAAEPGKGPAWQPTLIRIGGTSDVYLVVGGLKISFCNADVFGAQGFAWEQVREVTAADPLWQLPGIGCR